MELFIEEAYQEENGYFLVSLYVREFKTTVLMEQRLYQQRELTGLKTVIEDFNERPWKFPAWQKDISDAIFAERHRLIPKNLAIKPKPYYDSIKPEPVAIPKTPEEIARQEAINKKIQESKERNKQMHLDNKAYSDALKEKAAKANRGYKYHENFHSSCLYGFHDLNVYVEPDMSDDCFGFGEIKVQQTLDDDIETLYAFYDDYIF